MEIERKLSELKNKSSKYGAYGKNLVKTNNNNVLQVKWNGKFIEIKQAAKEREEKRSLHTRQFFCMRFSILEVYCRRYRIGIPKSKQKKAKRRKKHCSRAQDILLPVSDHYFFSVICLFIWWFTLSNYFNAFVTMWLQRVCAQLCFLRTHPNKPRREKIQSEISNIGVEYTLDLFTFTI